MTDEKKIEEAFKNIFDNPILKEELIKEYEYKGYHVYLYKSDRYKIKFCQKEYCGCSLLFEKEYSLTEFFYFRKFYIFYIKTRLEWIKRKLYFYISSKTDPKHFYFYNVSKLKNVKDIIHEKRNVDYFTTTLTKRDVKTREKIYEIESKMYNKFKKKNFRFYIKWENK